MNRKFAQELRVGIIYTVFLMVFVTTLGIYRRLLLGEYAISYQHLSYGLVESLILAKVILLGKQLKIGEKFANQPLIIPTLYKTFFFSFLLLLFSVVEHFVMGYIDGKTSEAIYQEFIDIGVYAALIRVLIAFFVFIFFFAFMELARVIGEERLIYLFLFRKPNDDGGLKD